ncbi:MAG: hypothetical protein JNM97_20740, partial [Rhodoferax sp.]|nr:hypothetical protein [Rhodoferax sp.]
RGMQHQTTRASGSISALTAQLPTSARSSDASGRTDEMLRIASDTVEVR